MPKPKRKLKRDTRAKGKQSNDKFDDDRPFRKDIKQGYDGDMYSKPNDPRWYAADEQLLKDAASFAYAYPVGGKFDLGKLADAYDVNAIPGVMAIYTAPTFGWSDSANSPINIAARNIFTYVRHANSGSWNYNAPDLMLYLMAMDSLFSYISYLKRIYGCMATYAVTNRYYPRAIVQAMGVSFTDIQANMADFRAYINLLAVKANKFVVPSMMSYTAKHEWMYSGIYADAATDKPQTYLFVPDGFYQYQLEDEGGIKAAGMLQYLKLMPKFGNLSGMPVESAVGSLSPTPLLTFQDLQNFGDNLVSPLLASQDINVMCGDILKAYGDKVHRIDGITETYTVLPAYSMEVMDQIQNLTLIGEFYGDTQLKQDATKGWLEFTPKFNFPYSFSNSVYTSPGLNAYWVDRFINFQQGDITPAMTMEASRMTNIVFEQDENLNTVSCDTIASEVAMYAHIYYYGEGDEASAAETDSVWQLWRSRTLYLSNTAVMNLGQPKLVTYSGANANVTDVYTANTDTAPLVNKVTAYLNDIPMDDVRNELADVFRLSHMLSNFDRHPFITINAGFIVNQVDPNGTLTLSRQDSYSVQMFQSTTAPIYTQVPVYSKFTGYLGDMAYYTIVDREDLKMMAQVALLSMLNPDR